MSSVWVRCESCHGEFERHHRSTKRFCSDLCLAAFLVGTEIADREWVTKANCRGCDPALFFPERGRPTEEARAVCQGCEVRRECLEYALVNVDIKHGMWGGMSEKQRRKIRGDRRRAERAKGAA